MNQLSHQPTQEKLRKKKRSELAFIVKNISQPSTVRRNHNIKSFLDADATESTVNDERNFMYLEPIEVPSPIAVAKDKLIISATQCGNIQIAFNDTVINLTNVLCVSNVKFNLMSGCSKTKRKRFCSNI